MVFESSLYPPLRQYFRKDYLLAREVPLASKKIDVVCARPKIASPVSNGFQEIVAIEMKVRNWKKALRQALVYQLCAHKVYVALWSDYLKNINPDYFDRYGIGIIAVDGDAEIIIESKESKHVNSRYLISIQKYLLDKVIGRGEKCQQMPLNSI